MKNQDWLTKYYATFQFEAHRPTPLDDFCKKNDLELTSKRDRLIKDTLLDNAVYQCKVLTCVSLALTGVVIGLIVYHFIY